MPRANSSVPRHRRHRKIVKMAKGAWGARHRTYVHAKDTVEKGLQYAYRDRRAKKRSFRRLWVARINAAARAHGMPYNKFMHALKEKGIQLDRKALAEMAVKDPGGFSKLVEMVRA